MDDEAIKIPDAVVHAELAVMASELINLAAMAASLSAAITQQQRKLAVAHRALAEKRA